MAVIIGNNVNEYCISAWRSALYRARVARELASTRMRVWTTPGLSVGVSSRIAPTAHVVVSSRGVIRIGARVWIGHGVLLQAAGGVLEIGDDVFVGSGTEIVAHASVTIGRDTQIASGCVIRDNDHRFEARDTPIRCQGHVVAPVSIGDDVWLASNVVVTRAAVIGRGVVVGANAVVRGELPPLAVAAGIPATVRRFRGERS